MKVKDLRNDVADIEKEEIDAAKSRPDKDQNITPAGEIVAEPDINRASTSSATKRSQ